MWLKKKDKKGVVTLNFEGMSESEKQSFQDKISQESGIEKFNGTVKYFFSYENFGDKDVCPACGAPTKICYADVIYATDKAPRVMFSPGFFCTVCPTVVLSEQFIREGIIGKFKYQGVLGLNYGDRRKPDLIETWNGEKPIYIFDEDRVPIGIATDKDLKRIEGKESLPYVDEPKQKTQKNKKKMIQKSKRKNRKKRK